MSTSNYFTYLEKSASPQVKRELRKMERSRQSSFSSVGKVLKEKYGSNVMKYIKHDTR